MNEDNSLTNKSNPSIKSTKEENRITVRIKDVKTKKLIDDYCSLKNITKTDFMLLAIDKLINSNIFKKELAQLNLASPTALKSSNVYDSSSPLPPSSFIDEFGEAIDEFNDKIKSLNKEFDKLKTMSYMNLAITGSTYQQLQNYIEENGYAPSEVQLRIWNKNLPPYFKEILNKNLKEIDDRYISESNKNKK